jgi:redox-sensitive bicupin YhaK (pirin superfamily)
VTPDWDAAKFPKIPCSGLILLVSGRMEDKDAGALYIHQDACIWGGILQQGAEVTQTLPNGGYLLVSYGEVALEGEVLGKGDGAAITELPSATLTAQQESKILLIELP